MPIVGPVPGHETVGREPELAALDRLLLDAQRGRGRLLLLTGEAGIGKSRLLTEAIARARARGLVALSGRAVDGGGALRPLAEALLPAAGPDLAGDPRLTAYRPVLARLLPGWPAEPAAVLSAVDPNPSRSRPTRRCGCWPRGPPAGRT